MNPGVSEEAGKVATGFIDAMKSQPVSLALCVICLVQLALVFYIAQASHSRSLAEMTAQTELQKLLLQCGAKG